MNHIIRKKTSKIKNNHLILIILIFYISSVFNLSAQNISNGSFETWQTKQFYDFPDNWFIINEPVYANQMAEKLTDSQDGNYSLGLKSVATSTDTLYAVSTFGYFLDNNFIRKPFNGLGDSLHFWYKSSIQPGDMGIMLLMLYNNGTLLDSTAYFFTGQTNIWSKISLPVNPTQQAPDSMFLAFASSIPEFLGGNPLPDSWIAIDNIYFSLGGNPIAIPVPNHSYENWSMASADEPTGWSTSNSNYLLVANDTANVIKTADAFTGDFAVRLTNIESENNTVIAFLEYNQAINSAPEKISFYYKYFPNGTDTAQVFIDFYKNNALIYNTFVEITSLTNLYSLLRIDFTHNEVPDEISISFISGTKRGSILIIDNIRVDCIPPKNLHGKFTSSSTAQLTWDAGSNETEWFLEWGLKGFTTGTGQSVQVNNTPEYIINGGITDFNSYDFYVKSICDINDESYMAGPFTFCKAATIPLSEDFETTVSENIPDCWHKSDSIPSIIEVTEIDLPNQGSKHLSFNTQNYPKLIFTTPILAENISDLMISFFAKKNASTNHAVFQLGTMANPSNPETFYALESFSLTNTYTEYTYSLNSYSGTDSYIAFRLTSNDFFANAYIDDINIDFIPSCPPPINLIVDNVTTNEADISWNQGGNELLWNISYGLKGFDILTEGITQIGLSSPSINLIQLNSGHTYDFYVQADCGNNDLSIWIKTTFSTPCTDFTAPFVQNFENTDENNIPLCWQKISSNGGDVFVNTSGATTSGIKSLNMNWVDNQSKSIIITPILTNNISDLFISFNSYNSGINPATINIGTITNPSDVLTFNPLQSFLITESYENYTFYFHNYTGTDNYIAISLSSQIEANTVVFIDDISIDYIPACIPPNTVNISNISGTSAQVNWQAGNDETLWNLVYGISGFNPDYEGTQINGLTSTDYFLNNVLNNGMQYDVYIQSDCNGSVSTFVKKTFSTPCLTFDAPVFENFELSPVPAIPNCWSKLTSISGEVETLSLYQSPSGFNSLRMFINANDFAYFITPEIENDINELNITFYAKKSSQYNSAILEIGTMSDPIDKNTFSLITQYTLTDNFQQYDFAFNLYNGNDKYIAFNLISNELVSEIYIDDILIDIQPGCLKPLNLSASQITQSSALLSWSPGGNENIWEAEIGTQGFMPGSQSFYKAESNLGDSIWSVDNLMSHTHYEYYVRANCGSGDYSSWAGPFNFITACGNFSIPFSEDFSNPYENNLPLCWHSDVSNWLITNLNIAGGSLPEVFFDPNPNISGKHRLISPYINTQNHNTLILSFKHALFNSNTNNTFTVGIEITTDDISWDSIWSVSPLSSIPAESIVIDISAYAGSTFKLAFYFEGSNSYDFDGWFIDDIHLEEPPTCPKPSQLNASNIQDNSALLSWVAGGTENLWNLEVGLPGFTPGTTNYVVLHTGISINNKEVNNLTGSTIYEFYVQADCGNSDLSEWAGPYSFSTLCGIFSVPFTEDFSSCLVEDIPNCWNRTANNWQCSASSMAGGTFPELKFYYTPQTNGRQRVTSPFIDATQLSSLMITFRHILFHYPGNPYSIGVEVSTDDINWTTIWEITPDNFIPSQLIQIDASIYAGETIKIAWFFDGDSYDTDSWYIDNINVDEIITCPKPLYLNAFNIKHNEAEIYWQPNGSENLWQIEYGMNGFLNGHGTTQLTSTSQLTLNNLTANTAYDYFVRAICGIGDTSYWSGPYTFTTDCDLFTTPYNEDFDFVSINQMPACWKTVFITSNDASIGVSDVTPYSSPNSLHIKNGNTPQSNSTLMALTPMMENLNQNQITFYAKSNKSNVDLIIGTIESHADLNSFMPVKTISLTQNYQKYYVSFTNYSLDNGHIAFKHGNPNAGNDEAILIDNLKYESLETCPAPTPVNLINFAPDSVNAEWVENGNAQLWQIEWGLQSYTQGTGNQVFVSNNSHVITGLELNTFYDFYVRSICGIGDTSNWAGPYLFFNGLLCPSNCIFSQSAVPVDTFLLSSQESSFRIYQKFNNVNSVFNGLSMWIIQNYDDGNNLVECYKSPMDFEITFYEDNNNKIGTVTNSFITSGTPDSTNALYNNHHIYKIDLFFPQIIQLSNGWFSISSLNSPICFSNFASTSNPDAIGYALSVYNDIDTTQHLPLGFCFNNQSHIVNYIAGAGGFIQGQAQQNVSHGAYSTEVEAVAEPCYEFLQWNDGSTINPRTDGPITNDISFTASFVLKNITHNDSYTLCQGDTLFFENQILTEQGNYTGLFQNYYGCDSTVNLTLFVNPSYTYNFFDTICEGEIYTWRGDSYTLQGIYSDNQQTFLGCDSIFKLYLFVHPSYEYVYQENICSGDSILWRGNYYNNDGIYYDSLLTQYGCDSIFKLVLNVFQPYSFYDTINICIGDTIIWHNNSYFSAGIYYDSLLTQYGCDSIFVLSLSTNQKYFYTEHDTICSNDTYIWHGQQYFLNGTYYDSLLTTNGCDSIYKLNLFVNQAFVNEDTAYICPGDSFFWRGEYYSTQDSYYMNYLTESNCDSIFALRLFENPTYNFIQYQSICFGSICNWRGNTYNTTGTFTDSLTTALGCDSVYTLYLTVNSVFSDLHKDTICQGDTLYWRGNKFTNTGFYYDSFLTNEGCDSTYILQLYVNPTYLFTLQQNICEGDTFTWRGQNYYETGIYRDSLISSNGCDSIYVLDLFKGNEYLVNHFDTICAGNTYEWHGITYNSGGIFYDTLQTAIGCDSICALYLYESPSYSIILDDSICTGYNYSWRGNIYTMAGTYYDSLFTIQGCDSIYILNLKVNTPYESIEFDTICEGSTYNWLDFVLTTAGTYSDTLQGINGCDSICILHLFAFPVFEVVENEEICSGDSLLWRGNYYSIQGIYYDSLQSTNNCDSIFKLNLNVFVVDVTVTLSNAVFTANSNADSYQWLDCDNSFEAIQGENSYIFAPLINGYYAVAITHNNCTDTSNCILVSDVSINKEFLQDYLHLYPNPNTGSFILENTNYSQIIIYNSLGIIVYESTFEKGLHHMQFKHLANGIYFLKANTMNSSHFIKIVIQK